MAKPSHIRHPQVAPPPTLRELPADSADSGTIVFVSDNPESAPRGAADHVAVAATAGALHPSLRVTLNYHPTVSAQVLRS